jgi:hypothetical protein
MGDENTQKNFWSTVPGILTGIAAVITAVGGLIAWIFSNSPYSDKQLLVKFPVEAVSQVGFPYTFHGNNSAKIRFRASGQWAAIPTSSNEPNAPRGYVDANGYSSFSKNPSVQCNQHNLGALIVRTEGGNCITGGREGIIELQPEQTVYFLMNDIPGMYSDNTGAIQVELFKAR